MPIDFTRNDRPTIGVEVELHLVDSATGDLVAGAIEVLAEMGSQHPDGKHPKAKHELFQSTVEIITGVCETPAEARLDLQETLDELSEVAARRGLMPLSAGTHPFGLAREQLVSPDPRYHELIEAMQWPARRLLICGMHVHVGVPTGEHAIPVINELTRHLPLFLALSASSPYFEGEDSGLASARAKVFEGLPTAGLPPQISDWVDFEQFMSTLLDSECITSIREVWWDIRPHPDFGTVELRMCDARRQPCARPMALAALAQTLVAWCLERSFAAGDPARHPRASGRCGRIAGWRAATASDGDPHRRRRRCRWTPASPFRPATSLDRTRRPAAAGHCPSRWVGPARSSDPFCHILDDRFQCRAVSDACVEGGEYPRRRGASPRPTNSPTDQPAPMTVAPESATGRHVDALAWRSIGEGLVAIRRNHPRASRAQRRGVRHHRARGASGSTVAGLDPARARRSGTGLLCDLDRPDHVGPGRASRCGPISTHSAMADDKDGRRTAVRCRGWPTRAATMCTPRSCFGTALYFARHREELPGSAALRVPARRGTACRAERVERASPTGGLEGVDAVVGVPL